MNDDVYLAGRCVTASDSEPWAPADIGRNFKACARGIGGQHKERALLSNRAATALKVLEKHPILTEQGAMLMAQNGRAVR